MAESDDEIRARISRSGAFAGLESVPFPDNARASNAFRQIGQILTARFGRGAFSERAPTWADLARYGIVNLPQQVSPTADPTPTLGLAADVTAAPVFGVATAYSNADVFLDGLVASNPITGVVIATGIRLDATRPVLITFACPNGAVAECKGTTGGGNVTVSYFLRIDTVLGATALHTSTAATTNTLALHGMSTQVTLTAGDHLVELVARIQNNFGNWTSVANDSYLRYFANRTIVMTASRS